MGINVGHEPIPKSIASGRDPPPPRQKPMDIDPFDLRNYGFGRTGSGAAIDTSAAITPWSFLQQNPQHPLQQRAVRKARIPSPWGCSSKGVPIARRCPPSNGRHTVECRRILPGSGRTSFGREAPPESLGRSHRHEHGIFIMVLLVNVLAMAEPHRIRRHIARSRLIHIVPDSCQPGFDMPGIQSSPPLAGFFQTEIREGGAYPARPGRYRLLRQESDKRDPSPSPRQTRDSPDRISHRDR